MIGIQGKIYATKINFWKKNKEKIEEVISLLDCSFYFGKRVMTFSVQLAMNPTAEIVYKILKNVYEIVDVYFAETNIICKTGWCSSYMLDKRIYQSVYLVELSWLNISPNHSMYKKPGKQYNFVPFSLCSCFSFLFFR